MDNDGGHCPPPLVRGVSRGQEVSDSWMNLSLSTEEQGTFSNTLLMH